MSFTVTIPTWLLPAWLAVGLVLWLPLEYAAYRQTNSREAFWAGLRRRLRRRSWRALPLVAFTITTWPLGVYEVARWPVKKRWRRIRRDRVGTLGDSS